MTGLVRRQPSDLAEDVNRLIGAGQLTVAALQAGSAVNDLRLTQTVLERFDPFTKTE